MNHSVIVEGRAASVLLIDTDGRVLLVRHNYGLRRWTLPGGVVEPDETMAEAAIREAQEEVGVLVEIDGLHGSYLIHGMNRPTLLSDVFRARVLAGVPHIADEQEIAEICWCDPARLPTPLTHDARAALLDHAAGVTGCERSVVRQA